MIERLTVDLGKNFTILLFPFSDHDRIDVRTNEFDPAHVPSLLNWVFGVI